MKTLTLPVANPAALGGIYRNNFHMWGGKTNRAWIQLSSGLIDGGVERSKKSTASFEHSKGMSRVSTAISDSDSFCIASRYVCTENNSQRII